MIFALLCACGNAPAPQPGATETEVLDVPAGATASTLGPTLAARGLVASELRWKLALRTGLDASCIKAGRHEVSPGMDARTLVAALCGPPLPVNEPFTVVEGWRIREIDAALVEKGWAKPGEYTAAVADASRYHAEFPLPADGLEGYLFPETYMVDPTQFRIDALVQRQLDLFAEKFWSQHRGELGARSLDDVVTMASMIEREEPTPANRALVAGILWKRIDHAWNLGVDATSRYPLPDWNDRERFLDRLADPKDPYNTRLRPGLPPTPIGNPGVVALVAAIRPEDSPYWYYLHDATHTLHPAKDVREHEANRRRYDVH